MNYILIYLNMLFIAHLFEYILINLFLCYFCTKKLII